MRMFAACIATLLSATPSAFAWECKTDDAVLNAPAWGGDGFIVLSAKLQAEHPDLGHRTFKVRCSRGPSEGSFLLSCSPADTKDDVRANVFYSYKDGKGIYAYIYYKDHGSDALVTLADKAWCD